MTLGIWVERRISIALVSVIILQTFGALIWAGGAAERITRMEGEAARVQELSERAVRLEAQFSAMSEALARIEAKVDRLNAAK